MTVLWKYGTTYLHSLTVMEKEITKSWKIKTLIQVWDLERLAVVMQDVDSVFDIDTMKAIRDKVCEMCS